jgi:hypothetical protein
VLSSSSLLSLTSFVVIALFQHLKESHPDNPVSPLATHGR